MKTIKTMLFALLLMMVPAVVSAEGWVKIYGGSGQDGANDIQLTSEGGYIVAGIFDFYGQTNSHLWMLKVDSEGNIKWQKRYGGDQFDSADSVQQTADGGYIVAGSTTSFGAGANDLLVLKLNSDGSIQWQKTLGTIKHDEARVVHQTSDGGFIIAGETDSFTPRRAFVLKLDQSGSVLWQKSYGGSDFVTAYDIQETEDGGYIVSGFVDIVFQTSGTDQESSDSGRYGALVLKLNSEGNIEWQKVYSNAYAHANSIRQTKDRGFIVTGEFPGQPFIMKLNEDGSVQWSKNIDGGSTLNSVQQTEDGGYVAAGGNLIIKFDQNGNVTWQKAYRGGAMAIIEEPSGGYIVVGSTFSDNESDLDALIMKLDRNGDIENCGLKRSLSISTTDIPREDHDANIEQDIALLTSIDDEAVVDDTSVEPSDVCSEGFIPIPDASQVYSYEPLIFPFTVTDPSAAKPLAFGNIAITFLGQVFPLSLQVSLLPFTDPVDIYGAFTHSSDPDVLHILNSDLSFQSVSFDEIVQSLKGGSLPAGIVPWKENTAGPINDSFLGEIPPSSLRQGTYSAYLLVTPTGRLDSYYLWKTYFVVP